MAQGKPLFVVKGTFLGKFELRSSSNEDLSPDTAHKYLLVHRLRHDILRRGIKIKVFPKGLKISRASVFSEVIGSFYQFSQIQRFFVFRMEPCVLILAHEQAEKNNFILIRFKSERSLNRVCDEIERAKASSRSATLAAATAAEILQQSLQQQQHELEITPPPTPEFEEDEICQETGHASDFDLSQVLDRFPMLVDQNETRDEKEDEKTEENEMNSHPSPPPPPLPMTSDETSDDLGIVGSSHSTLSQAESMIVKDDDDQGSVEIKEDTSSTSSYSIIGEPSIVNSISSETKQHENSVFLRTNNDTAPDEEWEVSEYYIDPSPSTGPCIVTDGPIYMFCARQKHSRESHMILICESSSPISSASSHSSRQQRNRHQQRRRRKRKPRPRVQNNISLLNRQWETLESLNSDDNHSVQK